MSSENYKHNKKILGGVNIADDIQRRITVREAGVIFFINVNNY